jgi:hypothetical protein
VSAPSHDEFVQGYRAGRLRVHVDAKRAADFMSARLLLPLILLPVFGIAVGLAVLGLLLAGGAVLVAAIAVRALIRRSSRGFVIARALQRDDFYREALESGALRVEGPPGADAS